MRVDSTGAHANATVGTTSGTRTGLGHQMGSHNAKLRSFMDSICFLFPGHFRRADGMRWGFNDDGQRNTAAKLSATASGGNA